MVDLPLTREKGVSYPYVQVLIQAEEDSQNLLFYEVLNYTREKTCHVVGLTMERIRTSSLKFVVLDYDKFSRTEFIADVAMPMEHINLEGDEEARPLCVVSNEEVSFLICFFRSGLVSYGPACSFNSCSNACFSCSSGIHLIEI